MSQWFPSFQVELVRLIVAVVALAAYVGVNALVLVLLERKLAGHFQRRPGPYEVGPHGVLQPFCDALKLMGKQLFTPNGADKFLFWLAPILAFLPIFILFLPIEFGPGLFGLDFNMGLLLILAYAGFSVLSLCIAGWSSNNKYALLGAARAVSQSVAYEIPLLLAVLAVAFMTGSLDLHELVAGQGSWPWQWNVVLQPVAFIIYFTCAVAETNRAPFDLPEGESELTAGYHTEYSGMGFGLFFLAEYTEMVVVSAVATILFLGGWKGPFFDGIWWFAIKIYVLVFVMIWFRWTFPRIRFDQMLNICWKWLIPLALLNLFITAVVIKIV